MTFPSLSAVNCEWWDDICKSIKNAAVFIDQEACECLHWNGGFARLLEVDVGCVKTFSSSQNVTMEEKNAVFLLCSPLLGSSLMTLKNILKCNDFSHCRIISCAHPSVHLLANPDYDEQDESLIIKKLERQLLACMSENSKLEIKFCPIFMAPLCSSLFVTPAFRLLFPFLPTDLKNLEFESNISASKLDKKLPEQLNEIEFANLPFHFQINLMMFAHCFNSFFESLNVKEDYFAVGHCSRVIASVLEGLAAAKTRRKNAPNKVSVLFVDRTLDLVSSSGHGIDTLMDRILNLLPRFPGHKNDVAVDMHPVSFVPRSTSETNIVLAPGCLAENYHFSAGSILNSIFLSKYKECLMEINRALVEVITKEKLMSTLSVKPGRVSVETLDNYIRLFQDRPDILKHHIGLVQSSLAVVQALKHWNNSHLDQLYGIEKGLLQSLGNSSMGQSTLCQCIQLLKTRKERSICVEEILVLLIHIYSLAGENIDDWKYKEDKLQEEIAKVLLEDSELLSVDLKNYIGENIDEYSTHAAVESFFHHLHDIAVLRNDMKKYRNVYDSGLKAQAATYTPLIQQILSDILNPTRPELPDIEFKSTGLKNILKTGVSYFMSVNKPRPCDNPLLIFFIVGGITTTEVRQIREAVVTQRPDLQVLIGSTQLVIPEDILHNVLNPSIKSTY